jgi:multidrug efflux pump subunit AcrB
MGVVISFGLAAGTLLTLVVVPVLYSMFFRVEIPKSV